MPDRQWKEYLAKLRAFRRRFGHCRVPAKWTVIPGLAKWVVQQRDQFHALPLKRLDELFRFGFDFGGDRYWVARFCELLEFKRTHGHCNVPARWTKNPQLGGWLSGQRARRDSMPVRRRKLFDRTRLDWAPLEMAWNRRYEELVEFKRVSGHCNVPGQWTKNPQLGLWVGNVRHRKRRLTPRQLRLLDRLGFDWSPVESLWSRHLKELQEFRSQHGHCNVPPKYSANPALGSWVAELRKFGPSKVAPKWKRQLASLSFDWSPARTRWWENRFSELRAFQKEHGHCRVVAAGVSWDVRQASWEERYAQLQHFWKRHGHSHVPRRWSEHPGLGGWVLHQRDRKSTLSADRIRKLNKLSFRWPAPGGGLTRCPTTGRFIFVG